MFLLTGKHKAEYDRLVQSAAVHESDLREIARLEKRLEHAEAAWKYERERADRAVDGLLESKGLPPVLPVGESPEDPDPFRTDEVAREKWLTAHGLKYSGASSA